MDLTRIKELLGDHQYYHSELQMDSFITIQNGGTTYGMYKQALRELCTRWDGLRESWRNIQLLRIDIEELEETEAKPFDQSPFDAKRNQVNLVHKRAQLETAMRQAHDMSRELGRFYAQAEALKVELGVLTAAKRRTLERELWIHSLRAQCAMDVLGYGRVQAPTLRHIGCLPSVPRAEVLASVEDAAALLKWFTTLDNQLPSFEDPNLTLTAAVGLIDAGDPQTA